MRLFQNFTQSIILGKTSGSIYYSPVMIILGTLETSSLSLFFFKNVCAAKRQSCILPLFTQVFCETGSWQLLELMSAYSASSAVTSYMDGLRYLGHLCVDSSSRIFRTTCISVVSTYYEVNLYKNNSHTNSSISSRGGNAD